MMARVGGSKRSENGDTVELRAGSFALPPAAALSEEKETSLLFSSSSSFVYYWEEKLKLLLPPHDRPADRLHLLSAQISRTRRKTNPIVFIRADWFSSLDPIEFLLPSPPPPPPPLLSCLFVRPKKQMKKGY